MNSNQSQTESETLIDISGSRLDAEGWVKSGSTWSKDGDTVVYDGVFWLYNGERVRYIHEVKSKYAEKKD